MILHARWQGHHHSTRPVLVWLHGFLGSADDWLPVQHFFRQWPMLSIDLPGHGGSQAQTVNGFSDLSHRLTETLNYHKVDRYWLIGYSLGARLAFYHACRHNDGKLCGLVAEAGHFGLSRRSDRETRRQHDMCWAQRFRQMPLSQALTQWYQQPLFAELTAQQRQSMISRRLNNRAEGVARMLEATSLSTQPDLLPELQHASFPFHYLCGEWDSKFLQLAQQAGISCVVIRDVGHNTHQSDPLTFAYQLTLLLNNA